MIASLRTLATASLLALLACGEPDVVYEEDSAIEGAAWSYGDSLAFEYEIADTSGRYDLVLSIDHTEDFAYQNFYVRLTTHLPDGEVLQQPLSLQLADRFGDWHGDCSGESCTIDIALQEATRFTEAGTHRLVVSQYSRDEPLEEIQQVSFRVIRRPG